MKTFIHFAFLSGLGWMCDFCTYAVLVEYIGLSGPKSNFISSYVGLTFVWFTSLKAVFNRRHTGSSIFLTAYWVYQFFSILLYSSLLTALITMVNWSSFPSHVAEHPDLSGKFIITPFNLFTNYLFMAILTRYMQKDINDEE